MSSSVVWFELPAEDTNRAQEFYAQLLGWKFEPFGEEDYHMSADARGAVYGAPGEKGLLAISASTTSTARLRVSVSSAAKQARSTRSRVSANTPIAPTARATGSGSTGRPGRNERQVRGPV